MSKNYIKILACSFTVHKDQKEKIADNKICFTPGAR